MGPTLHDNIPRALIVPWTEILCGTVVEANIRTSAPSEVQPVDTSDKESDYPVTLPIGDRLLHFTHQWETSTTDAWVLQTVRLGLTLEFLSSPLNHFITCPVSNNQEKRQLMDAEIHHLLNICAIETVPAEQRGTGFYSILFLVPKSSGAGGGSWTSSPEINSLCIINSRCSPSPQFGIHSIRGPYDIY